MNFQTREGLLGQLEAMQVMADGLFKQIESIKRTVLATADSGETPAHRVIKTTEERDPSYTSNEEDVAIDKMLKQEQKTDQLLTNLVQASQQEGLENNEQPGTDIRQ